MNKDYWIAASSLFAVVVTALFGLIANRQKFREDLQSKYDSIIHNQRTAVYLPLWKDLEALARYAPPEPVTPNKLKELSRTLREWFFRTGGLFLSNDSRRAYLDLQEEITVQLSHKRAADQELDKKSLKQVHDKASALREQLSKDVGSRKSAQFDLWKRNV